MKTTYFSALLPELSTRAARSTIGVLGFSNAPLRKHLLDVFSRGYGQPGCFLGDPVFEATFGWKLADETMGELSGKLLHPEVVRSMDKPWGTSSKDYEFLKSSRPYKHQIASWRALLGPGYQSVVITSGTGSGKTECFMVPILSSIAQAKKNIPNQTGVKAIFLYPLNALIQSQRERLRAWTGPMNGDIRFCLYNGMTPEEAKADKYREAPHEVHDRTTLRSNPPSILVTNPTMLEYMLVRAQDASILDKSQGQLEWIVLDEAHNYIGSQAAELALLLRRVLHAFGTNAEKVRFVATSATIGSNDETSRSQLQQFLARLAGVSPERVTVIQGERQYPEIDTKIDQSAAQPFEDLVSHSADPEGTYKRLSADPTARRIRSMFLPAESGSNFQPLSAIRNCINGTDGQALQWLDLLTTALHGSGRFALPFLPLRLHAFHNTMNGLWACVNPACTEKVNAALEDAAWKYGMVHMDEIRKCACGAPVLPLVSCNDCNETYLSAEIVSAGSTSRLVSPLADEVDEFNLDRDPEEDEDQTTDDDSANIKLQHQLRIPVLVVNGSESGSAIFLNPDNNEFQTKAADSLLELRVQDSVIEDDQLVLKCPGCTGFTSHHAQFRKALLGAPFQLGNIIPTLLEFCPDGDVPLDMPRRGRRMITFTDSRQGTARIAAKLQQDAERNALRASVYKKLVSQTVGATGEREKLSKEIEDFNKLLPPDGPLRELLLAQISEKTLKLAKETEGKPVPYNDMVDWLARQSTDIGRWIYNAYLESDSNFGTGKGKEDLVKILVCREFGRRPKRQNSLETMGLVAVQYPKLAQVVMLRPAVQAAGFSLSEWRDFLKIMLDFYVRGRFAISLPQGWERWGGVKGAAKKILPPKSLEASKRLLKWPKVLPYKNQNMAVRLLAYVLHLDPLTEHGRDRIDSLLLAAWDDLAMTSNLLQAGDQGRYLDLTDISFQTITRGWICPVTRRVLDVTFRGVTPYLPAKQVHDGVAKCKPLDIPVCNVIAQDFATEDDRIEAARRWVDAHPALSEARIEGVWSNLNERVIEGAGYFRSVEHSAQQSGSRLELYESQFKQGLINLMSCSTTMEMGVDIGGINTVAMNNVPPHPANYLQRAGRAGRRGETRSVALTVCKNNPHDQNVFRNTTWPFTTRLRTPGISLDSPLLVQRHINSMLLAKFLRTQAKDGKLMQLTLDWWMFPRGESRQERFTAWCECYDPTKHADVQAGITDMTRRTVFEGRNISTLVNETGRTFKNHARDWMSEYEAIKSQMDSLVKRSEDDKVPMKALDIQMSRVKGEYLLREMATSGVLPGYGFPTDITTFETLNKDSREIQQSRDKSIQGREDNRFQRRELPSRDTVTALREYAPGASVVIDGLVYESAGITLNWHAPASLDAVNEIQNIRRAWRCGHCGSSGTFVRNVEACPECGTSLSLSATRPLEYLEPAGFSVDLFAQTHNDITLQEYVPVEDPWITAQGAWMPLVNPSLGRFRSTPTGSVFHFSSGVNRSGYALCLECGRSAPMGSTGDPNHGLPRVFQNSHKRLRGRQGGNDWVCGGSDGEFKIKKGINFGREYTTDVLELSLCGLDGAPLTDGTVAYTLAVALRRAIAESLGIEETELGCESKMIRDDFGRKTRSIQIFDIRSAGYSSLVAPDLPNLLRSARSILQCDANCEGACQSCLLNFDTRYHSEDLDRIAALKFITDEWINSLSLSADDRLFGEATQSDYQPLNEAITREINRGNARSLYVYLHGDLLEWDLPGSGLRKLLHRLSAIDPVQLYLVSADKALDKLSQANASILESLRSLGGVHLRQGIAPKALYSGVCLATLEHTDGSFVSWGTKDQLCTLPAQHWGDHGREMLVVAPTSGPAMSNESVNLPQFNKSADSLVRVFPVLNEVDGSGSGFGVRLWNFLSQGNLENLFPTGKVVQSIHYEDRYIATPLASALLVETISAIKSYYEQQDGWSDVEIKVATALVDESRPVRYRNNWNSDWETSALRDEAMMSAFEYSGMSAKVSSTDKRYLIHGRRLTIRFRDGCELVAWFDQGLSYWGVARAINRTSLAMFSVDREVNELGIALADIRVNIEGHELPTQVFLDLQKLAKA
jgi:DEAD/DEAH box helicase domain-containing protein